MARVRYDADAKTAIKAAKDLAKAQEEIAKGANSSAAAFGKADKEGRKFLKSVETAQQRYNRRLQETAELQKRGIITQRQASNAATELRRRFDRLGDAGKKAFGSGAIASVGRFAASFVSLGAAVSAVTQALRENAEERERAISGSKQAVRGEASLAQLAVTQGGTLAERKAAQQRLLAESRAAFASGAFGTRDESGDAIFGLNSAGLSEKDRKFAVRVRRSGAISNIAGAATSFSALTKALGEKEVGSFDDFLDKALQASSLAPAQANEIPLAAARAGASAKALGISDEFLFASTALLSGVTGSASEGGTRVASFLKQVEKALPDNQELKGLKGLDLVKAIAALPEDQQGFGGILGDRAEAVAGFRTLRDNLVVLEREVANITSAQSNNLASQAIQVAESDPNTRAAIFQRQKKNQLELSLLDESTNNLLFEASLDARKRVRRQNAASGSALDRAGVEAGLVIESVQVGLETLFGLRDAADFKRGVQGEIASEGDIRDQGLIEAIRENTESNKELAKTRQPVTGRAE